MQDFAALLLAARERLGITQSQLAAAAGLTASYVSLLENRKKPPPSDRVCGRLAAVLGIPAKELLEVAHLERSPATVRQRVHSLRGRLTRERRSRQRVLESLLSPFLFPSAPSWIEGAVEWIGGSTIRRRRLKEVLAALGRRHQDRATAVSRLIDELPERDRRLLLEALPRILGRRDGSVAPANPPLYYALPPEPKAPYLLAWTREGSAGELRDGDLLLVDPSLELRDGDLILLRGSDDTPLARRVVRAAGADGAGGSYRLLALEGGEAEVLPEAALRERFAREGAGIVVEIRRPVRRRGS
jgi:transcriptional regulator with XRE-family HTH domain